MRPLQYQPMLSEASNVSSISGPYDIRQIINISLQVLADTGSCAGTFQLQVCNTPCLNSFLVYNPPNAEWTDLGTALTFSQTSTSSNQLITKTDVSYVAIRLVFTDTSGGTNTSLVTASLAGQGL